MPNLRVVLLASGSGSLAQAIFEANLEVEFLALISDKQSLALSRAEKFGIPAIHLPVTGNRSDWNRELVALVSKLNPDLVISVGFMKILPPEFVNKFKTINTHPALLPNFPGAHAVADALAAQATVTGSPVHWVDEGVDTGKVIIQEPVAILADDGEESLHERIKIVERRLIVETLKNLISNGIPEHI